MTMPEEIWMDGILKIAWPTQNAPPQKATRTPYILKSTVDAQRAADDKTIRSLEGDLEMSNEAIRLSREHLKEIGIHAAFFDDCVALAAKKVLEQQETIAVLAETISGVVCRITGQQITRVEWLIKELKQALSDHAPRIADARRKAKEEK